MLACDDCAPPLVHGSFFPESAATAPPSVRRNTYVVENDLGTYSGGRRMLSQVATTPNVPHQSGTQSPAQVAVSAEVREQMRVLANIMVDVFLEHRKATREAKKQAGGPELQ